MGSKKNASLLSPMERFKHEILHPRFNASSRQTCSCQIATNTEVYDSRSTCEGRAIRRRRQCLACGGRYTTYEVSLSNLATVIGETEALDQIRRLLAPRKPITIAEAADSYQI